VGAGGFRASTRSVEIWGVLNMTPDSFSDGGRFVSTTGGVSDEEAVRDGQRMWAEGACVIDIGGASSRPPGKTYGKGAAAVGEEDEIQRVVPVITALSKLGIRTSVDTTRAAVAEKALAAGANIVNDVSMGASDALLKVVAQSGAELVLMHSREGGRIDARTTAYRDVVSEVLVELELAVERAVACGISSSRIWIDPGIGFAKTASQSAMLLSAIDRFVATTHRVLVGASRKSFLAELAPDPDGSLPPPSMRLGGSLAAVTAAALAGAHAVRVHDVAASRQAALVSTAIREKKAEEARAHA
jgi:dihydropteroate synthase